MLSRKIDKVVFWSDSEITLHWVKAHPSTLSVFVEMQEWSQDVIWKHVPIKQYPADIVSRGPFGLMDQNFYIKMIQVGPKIVTSYSRQRKNCLKKEQNHQFLLLLQVIKQALHNVSRNISRTINDCVFSLILCDSFKGLNEKTKGILDH